MAKKKEAFKELSGLSDKDLQARLKDLRTQQRELSFKTQGDQIRDVHQGLKVRKEIARILTILNEKGRIN